MPGGAVQWEFLWDQDLLGRLLVFERNGRCQCLLCTLSLHSIFSRWSAMRKGKYISANPIKNFLQFLSPGHVRRRLSSHVRGRRSLVPRGLGVLGPRVRRAWGPSGAHAGRLLHGLASGRSRGRGVLLSCVFLWLMNANILTWKSVCKTGKFVLCIFRRIFQYGNVFYGGIFLNIHLWDYWF